MSDGDAARPLLAARHIVKDYPGVRALDGVSFDARAGEIHALVGENGAGKSTLIKILAGICAHGTYSGEVEAGSAPARFHSPRDAEAAGIAVIHQELALIKHLSVAENIFLGDEPRRFGLVDFDGMRGEAGRLMASLGVAMDVVAEVASLGVGQQQLVEIARALRRRSRVLILDEPTAALAEHEVDTLMAIMSDLRARGTALIYISHRLDEVLRAADRITVLRDGRTVASGPRSEWSRAALVSAMVGREMAEMFPTHESRPGRVVLAAEGITLPDPESPARRILDGVSFDLREGEVLGIAGLMGAGRTALLSTIFGAAPGPWRGAVRVGGASRRFRSPAAAIAFGLALIPEDRQRHGLVRMFPVRENLAMVHLRAWCRAGIVDSQREVGETSRVAAELGIRAVSLEAPAETLSGGNQQKTVLGKWLMRPPRVLLLDEPTRGIDVGAKAELYRLILNLTRQGMAVVMASSELPEILAIADRIMVLRRGRVSAAWGRGEATAERIMEAAA